MVMAHRRRPVTPRAKLANPVLVDATGQVVAGRCQLASDQLFALKLGELCDFYIDERLTGFEPQSAKPGRSSL